ncbi:cytochrome c [Variovorax boronicumulans]|uniref:c-type cytochrome n=1 Tax=Variovorax boronicumulans TaxID=436515 RepID=UPI003391701E
MSRSIITLAGLATTLSLLSPIAQASDALAAKNSCMACHAKDTKVVGPAFKDIAAKYAGDATATGKLIAKVKKGGSGAWGSIPMPPNAQLSDADAKALVTWILKMK